MDEASILRDQLTEPPPAPDPPPPALPDPAAVPPPVPRALPVGGPADQPIALVRAPVGTRPKDLAVFHAELRDKADDLIAACGQNNALAPLKRQLTKVAAAMGDRPDALIESATIIWFRLDELRQMVAEEQAERAKADRLSPEMPAAAFAAATAFVRAGNVTIKAISELDDLDAVAPGPDARRPRADLEQAAAVAKVLAEAPQVLSRDLAETLTEATAHGGVDPRTVELPPPATPARRDDAPRATPHAEEFAGRSILNTVLEVVRRAATEVRDAARSAGGFMASTLAKSLTRAFQFGSAMVSVGTFTRFAMSYEFVLLQFAEKWLPGPAFQLFKTTLDNIITILGGSKATTAFRTRIAFAASPR